MTRDTLEAFRYWFRAEIANTLQYLGMIPRGCSWIEIADNHWKALCDLIEKEQKHDE